MAEDDTYSIQTGEIKTFSTADYVLFSLVLAVSALIGVFYAVKDRKKVTTDTFMLAGHSMGVFPVAMSLAVTFLSALSLLGNPVEVYKFHTMYWWLVVSFLFAVAASAHIFSPFFFRLKVTTVFEYLQMRFNTPVRVLGSIFIILQTLIYFAFLLYAPSLALSSVTQVSLWGTVVGVGLVVTFYTTLGGMKAVVWTDTFQLVVMVAGLLAVLIRGSIVTGGFAQAWEVASERGRIKFDDFSADPSTRHSVWSVVVGGGFFWLSLYGVNQAQVQRCLSCSSVRHAQKAMWLNFPVMVFVCSLTFMIGVVMFAFYADCHPATLISRTDQLLPLFVMDILGDYTGIPGVFVACIFSGSLSSLSSGLNAISAVTIKDLVIPYCCPKLSDFLTTLLSKLIVVVFGAVGVTLAYVAGNMDGTVLQAAMSVSSFLSGPSLGLFVLGMFCPWANSLGALVGCLTSLAFLTWIGIGALVHKVITAVPSPLVTTGCAWSNVTLVLANASLGSLSSDNVTAVDIGSTAVDTAADDSPVLYRLYSMSYLYYTVTGAFVVVVVGLVVSFISGATKPSSLDPRLIFPLFDTLFPWLPECILKPLRFGIEHEGKYEKYEQRKSQVEAGLECELEVMLHNGPDASNHDLPSTGSQQKTSAVSVLYVAAEGQAMAAKGDNGAASNA